MGGKFQGEYKPKTKKKVWGVRKVERGTFGWRRRWEGKGLYTSVFRQGKRRGSRLVISMRRSCVGIEKGKKLWPRGISDLRSLNHQGLWGGAVRGEKGLGHALGENRRGGSRLKLLSSRLHRAGLGKSRSHHKERWEGSAACPRGGGERSAFSEVSQKKSGQKR